MAISLFRYSLALMPCSLASRVSFSFAVASMVNDTVTRLCSPKDLRPAPSRLPPRPEFLSCLILCINCISDVFYVDL